MKVKIKGKKSLLTLLSIFALITLTACSTGGISNNNENAFVSGDGRGFVVDISKRKTAPDISGIDIFDKPVVHKKGAVVVLNVWASWCSPCRAEAPLLADFAHNNPQIQFIGVLTRDNISAAKGFYSRFEVPYQTLASDKVLAKFKGNFLPSAIPTTLIIDAQGKVAARINGELTTSLFRDILNRVSGEKNNG